MRPNGSTPKTAEATQSWGRVTSMARWIARRKKTAPATPRVSVVMPVYNAETTLAECLTRLFQSTWEDFEVVLVDDGSTDQTRAIADNFPLRVVPTSGRVGPAAARNLGARVADGEVVFFIDSDVMVRADTLSRLMERYGSETVRVRAAKPEPPLPLAIQEIAVEVTQERAVDDDEDEGSAG